MSLAVHCFSAGMNNEWFLVEPVFGNFLAALPERIALPYLIMYGQS